MRRALARNQALDHAQQVVMPDYPFEHIHLRRNNPKAIGDQGIAYDRIVAILPLPLGGSGRHAKRGG